MERSGSHLHEESITRIPLGAHGVFFFFFSIVIRVQSFVLTNRRGGADRAVVRN